MQMHQTNTMAVTLEALRLFLARTDMNPFWAPILAILVTVPMTVIAYVSKRKTKTKTKTTKKANAKTKANANTKAKRKRKRRRKPKRAKR